MELTELSDDLDRMATPADWVGATATAAAAARTRLVERLEDLVTEVSAARTMAMHAEDAVRGVVNAVIEAQELARARGFLIAPDGTVVAPPHLATAADATHDGQVTAEEQAQRLDECSQRIDEALRVAESVDAQVADVLTRIIDGRYAQLTARTLQEASTQGATAATFTVPPPPGDLEAVGHSAGWWAALSPQERQWVITHQPDWIGNRDGIDFTSRDLANRRRLEIAIPRLRQRCNDLDAALADAVPGYQRRQLRRQRDDAEDQLQSAIALSNVAHQSDGHVLLFDLTHDRAQGAVAIGDLDTADRVAVFTPGLTSTVQDIGGYADRMRDMRKQVTKLQGDRHDGSSVATVVWLGYQAPQLTPANLLSGDSVALADPARTGGHDLARFYRGINTARDGHDPDLTALGHSYGSTTTGYALREPGTGVERSVMFGSPGLGVTSLDQLRTPQGTTSYIEAPWDPVGDLGRFGTDPTLMPTDHLTADERTLPDGQKLRGITLHTSYLDDGTTSQYNIAQAISNHTADAFPGANVPVGEIEGTFPTVGRIGKIILGQEGDE